jgi:small-conductance mechanosensitive channel/cytochrome c556
LLLAHAAPAQPGTGLPGSALLAGKTATPATNGTALAAQLQVKLADAKADLNRVLSSLSGSTNLPAGVTATELIEYRSALQRLVRTYQLHLDDLSALEASRQRQKELNQTIRSWSGFAEPPPYSVLLVDELRDSVQLLNAQIKAAEVSRDVAGTFVTEVQSMVKDTDESLRRLMEQLEGAKDPVTVARLTWQRNLLQARSRVGAAMASSYDTKWQLANEELSESRQRLALAQRQLSLAAHQVRFSQADLDKVLDNLAVEQRGLEQEIQSAESDLDACQKALAEARENLQKVLQEQPAGSKPDAVRRLQEVLEARSVQAQTSVQGLSVLRSQLEMLGTQRQMWQTRFALSDSHDLTELQAAQKRLTRMRALIESVEPYYRQQIEAAARQISQNQERLLNQGDVAGDSSLARERIRSYQQLEAIYHRGLQGLEKSQRAIVRWQEAFELSRRSLPFPQRLQDVFAGASSFLSKLWTFELVVVEDSITVDNQVIKGRRGVTTGKVVMAILILVVGYWLSNLVARWFERLTVKRLKVEPNQASLIRRWVRMVLVCGLVIFALLSVKIPLTVFAFAGGALAIGVGFGTQTLLKNFISGIIILFERPFRVGDVLDVAGNRGKVTGIGIRSSVLELWDNTEILIPNSTLLENNLTNWTYSNCKVRFTITVGVAYSSDTRRVATLLAEAAERHGLVQKEPKPQVMFTEFGDSALTFELRFWVDVLQHNAAQVSSDLRHMIAGTFGENGIVISFPQRDVHLTTDKPIAVRVVPSEAGAERMKEPQRDPH